MSKTPISKEKMTVQDLPVQCLSCCDFFWATILKDGDAWVCPNCGRKNYWFEKEEQEDMGN